MELKDHLRMLVERRGKMPFHEILEQLEQEAMDGRYSTSFPANEVLNEDMFELRNRGLTVELNTNGGWSEPEWVVSW